MKPIKSTPPLNAAQVRAKAEKDQQAKQKKLDNIAKQDAQVKKAQLELQKQRIDVSVARRNK